MELRAAEWVVAGYLGYVLAASWLVPAAPARRVRLRLASAAVAALVLAIASLPSSRAVTLVRDWAPGLWLLAGYWISGLLFVQPMPRLEEWLLSVDARVLRAVGLHRPPPRVARPLLELLELAYLCCYPLIPAGLAALYWVGARGRADEYWVLVLGSEFVCYAALPWLQSRPPRVLDPPAVEALNLVVRRLNLWIVRHGSIQVNTLPSAHTAGAVAVALAVSGSSPAAGWGFGAVAAGIAAGSVAGRYHYAVDALAGAGVALAVWAIAGRA